MYGIPSYMHCSFVKHFYTDVSCSVGSSNLSFLVKSGGSQGCIMSGLLFNIVIDWVLCKTTEGRIKGIRWTLTSLLEDLDYADDIVLLSHSSSDMQDKDERLNLFAQQVGLNINTQKTEVMTVSTAAQGRLPLDPGGKRKRRLPKSTWRKTVESELKLLNLNWREGQ